MKIISNNNLKVLIVLIISISCTNNKKSVNTLEMENLIEALQKESLAHTAILKSKTYQKIIEQGEPILANLKTSINDNSTKHYLSLMAISEIDVAYLQEIPEKRRVAIWINSLNQGGHHNDWGIAGKYLAGGASDLQQIGEEVIPELLPLLEDKTPSSIWGSKEVVINDLYQNRMCDFVFFLIQNILKVEVTYPITQAERDLEIKKLQNHLTKN